MEKVSVTFRDYDRKQQAAEYMLLFFVSLIFLLLFSLWTSPFYKNWYGCDASFFTLVGRGITEGKIMYRDFYDLKGPYFFFIEALGQLFIKGRLGIFILQLIALYASVVLIWNISLLFISKAKSSFIVAVFFFGHIATLWGGNTLEEFFLPISLLCLYLLCRFYVKASADGSYDITVPFWYSLLLGFSLGLIVFAKISVSGTVLGIIAALGFIMMSKKKWQELFLFILYVILGLMIATVPIIVYYSVNGCLMDMLNCVFITGFKRSRDFAELFNATWELKCSGAVFAFVFAVTHKKRCQKELCVVLMAMSAATYLLLHLGTPFYYYFTSVYPCLILALAMMLKCYEPMLLFESFPQAVSLILFSVYLLYYIPASLGTVRTALYDRQNTSYESYVNDSKDIAALIPEMERDEVFSFMLDMQWYEINNIMPCNRYVVNLPFFIALDENALPELLDFLNDTPPKWLVIGQDFEANLPDIAQVVYSKYTCIYDNSVGELYLLDE